MSDWFLMHTPVWQLPDSECDREEAIARLETLKRMIEHTQSVMMRVEDAKGFRFTFRGEGMTLAFSAKDEACECGEVMLWNSIDEALVCPRTRMDNHP